VSRVPLTLISLLGAVLFGLGILGTIAVSIGLIIGRIEISIGIVTFILTLNLILGLISILSIAAIGEYVGRILEETKSRPRYLVASFIKNGLVQKTLLKDLGND
jgi:hypothetical protein